MSRLARNKNEGRRGVEMSYKAKANSRHAQLTAISNIRKKLKDAEGNERENQLWANFITTGPGCEIKVGAVEARASQPAEKV